MRMHWSVLASLACVLAVAAVAAGAVVELPCPEPEPSFDPAGIDRTLKEPRYGSAKPMYRFFALGPAGRQVMALVIDESGGTGKGYDTLYLDLNADRDITAAGERFTLYAPQQPKRAKGHEGYFHVVTSNWGKPRLIGRRKLQVPDPVFDYFIGIVSAGISMDCVLKDGTWHTRLRMSDGSALWSPSKADAQVYRFGGEEFSFRNEHFAGKTVRADEAVFMNLTAPFFAGCSPSVAFRQAANWVGAGYDDINVHLESLADPSVPGIEIDLRGY